MPPPIVKYETKTINVKTRFPVLSTSATYLKKADTIFICYLAMCYLVVIFPALDTFSAAQTSHFCLQPSLGLDRQFFRDSLSFDKFIRFPASFFLYNFLHTPISPACTCDVMTFIGWWRSFSGLKPSTSAERSEEKNSL